MEQETVRIQATSIDSKVEHIWHLIPGYAYEPIKFYFKKLDGSYEVHKVPGNVEYRFVPTIKIGKEGGIQKFVYAKVPSHPDSFDLIDMALIDKLEIYNTIYIFTVIT